MLSSPKRSFRDLKLFYFNHSFHLRNRPKRSFRDLKLHRFSLKVKGLLKSQTFLPGFETVDEVFSSLRMPVVPNVPSGI